MEYFNKKMAVGKARPQRTLAAKLTDHRLNGKSYKSAGMLACAGLFLLSGPAMSADERVWITEAAPTVIINEVHASNLSGAREETRRFKDWVELYNTTDDTIDLTGWGLSNNDKNPFRWTFPTATTIDAGSYLRVWMSKRDRNTNSSNLHTNFNVDHGSDDMILSAPNLTEKGITVDSTAPPATLSDVSWCRTINGDPSSPFAHCIDPTPRRSNTGPMYSAMLEAPTISLASGVYDSAVTVSATGPTGAILRYTTDGSLPDTTSPTLNDSVTISASSPLRVAAFKDGMLNSRAATATYIIDNSGAFSGHRMVFLTMNPTDANYYRWRFTSTDPGWIGNVEMIDEDGTHAFNADAALGSAGRIGSRAGQDAYPVAIKFTDSLGTSKVNYPIFSAKPEIDSYKKLRLRNSGSDYNNAHLRDQFWQSFANDGMNMAGAAVEPTEVFVNGQYNGMMDLREREDETLIESTYNVDRDYVQYFSEGKSLSGDNTVDNFNTVRRYITGNSMAVPANYEQASKMLDMQAFADYFAMYAFSRSLDSMWRNDQVFTAPGMDDLWRVRPHDLDITSDLSAFGFNTYYTSGVSDVYNGGWEFQRAFRALLKNPEFENLFIHTASDQLNTIWNTAFTEQRHDEISGVMEKYIARHVQWGNYPASLQAWKSDVSTHRTFTSRRRPYFEAAQNAYFNLPSRSPLTVSTNNIFMGHVIVNSLDLEDWSDSDGNWSGEYHANLALPITAVPYPGFEFVRWEGDNTGTDPDISLVLSQNGGSLRAVFAPASTISVPVISAISDRTDETGDLISLDILATDSRNYKLTYDESKLPKGLDIHPDTGRIYGKLTRAGVYATRIKVDNGETEVETTFTWTVVNKADRLTTFPKGIDGLGKGLQASYFNNALLDGAPELERQEAPAVDVGGGRGVLPGFGTSNWTIRWEGTLETPIAGSYSLQTITRSHDGIRLWIDDQLLIDRWNGGSTDDAVDVDFALGELKKVRIEFLDISSSASLALNWRLPGSNAYQPVPLGVMDLKAVDPVTPDGLNVSYFDNNSFAGDPIATDIAVPKIKLTAKQLAHNGLPKDEWTVRWEGTLIVPTTGKYKLKSLFQKKDGARVWIDGTVVNDKWRGWQTGNKQGAVNLSAGEVPIKIEFIDWTGGARYGLQWKTPEASDKFVNIPASAYKP